MKQHKWNKEIKAWADGAIIQFELNGRWIDCQDNDPAWQLDTGYRIKPQPKEPQYLYVFKTNESNIYLAKDEPTARINGDYIGKIKLEVDDE